MATGRSRRWPIHALLLLVAVAGCRHRDVYPADVVDNFMRACSARSPEGVCRCALDKIQQRFTLEQFRAFEAQAARGETPKEMIDAATDCRP